MTVYNSISFLILAFIAIAVSAVLHYGFRLYLRRDIWAFLSKCVIAWFGAWLGPPVIGHWFSGMHYMNVWFVPATIGAVGAVILTYDIARTFGRGATDAAGEGRLPRRQ